MANPPKSDNTPPTIKKKVATTDVEFESQFYQYLAENKDYDLVFLNDPKVEYTKEGLEGLIAESELEGFGIVYVIEYKNYLLFFNYKHNKIGLMPKDRKKAFTC